MLEIIKNICFFSVSFLLFYEAIRAIMMCRKIEKKLKEVTNIEEFKKIIENFVGIARIYTFAQD